ncbi:hypothetical protein FB567DRAFT_328778 [Paraphoma chrysanthemicola]|uniref:BZIP domain-containing protein n=1 Tax=Paraphoma chrysanthemicola TaxID=798071 RepID=A0A8K0W094_9PLEO|nr:hypothetical protein FB567DRAFT_328778 [Paraphoma chrysanthemicola]
MSDLRISQKAQNLARIRDNQRRSRARRKEYLQELEAKIRSCEQVGIEASSEIQLAARKVLDENKKLRSLLHERGVSEPEVVVALGGSADRCYDQISVAPVLNAMLERRITCNPISSTSSPAPSHTRATSLPRHMPSAPPITIPAPRSTALSCCDSPSPSSIVSSMGTPPPVTYSAPFYTTPMTPSAPEIKSEDVRYGYPFDQSYNNSWQYSTEYNMANDSHAYYNASSCVDAANIIRTMRADVAPQSQTGIACHTPDQDYYMNGNVVFSMADNRYSHSHGSI